MESISPIGENVIHKDDKGYYAVVATTRPETIMGDTAMCINPKDPKNQWLKGRKVIVPLVNRVIPVIEDRYVDIEFGTGCLKVTPAHDVNDYALGKVIQISPQLVRQKVFCCLAVVFPKCHHLNVYIPVLQYMFHM